MSFPPRPPMVPGMPMPNMPMQFMGIPGMPPPGMPPLMGPRPGGPPPMSFFGAGSRPPPLNPNQNIRSNRPVVVSKPPTVKSQNHGDGSSSVIVPSHQHQHQHSSGPPVTVFVGNITEKWPDAMIRQLLATCGQVVNWKRVQGASGKLQGFGFCEFNGPDAGLRAVRLLHDLEVGDKKLVVKVDGKTSTVLEEYKSERKAKMKNTSEPETKDENNEDKKEEAKDNDSEDYMDEEMKQADERSKIRIGIIFREFKNEIDAYIPPGSEKTEKDPTVHKQNIQDKLHLLKLSSLDKKAEPVDADADLPDEMMEEGKREIITREISNFRENMKQEKQKEEERKKIVRERRERERAREERRKDSTKDFMRQSGHSPDRIRRDRSRSPRTISSLMSPSRQDRVRRSRSRTDDRSRRSRSRDRRTRERERDRLVVSRDREREQERERDMRRSRRSRSRDKKSRSRERSRERERSPQPKTKFREREEEEEAAEKESKTSYGETHHHHHHHHHQQQSTASLPTAVNSSSSSSKILPATSPASNNQIQQQTSFSAIQFNSFVPINKSNPTTPNSMSASPAMIAQMSPSIKSLAGTGFQLTLNNNNSNSNPSKDKDVNDSRVGNNEDSQNSFSFANSPGMASPMYNSRDDDDYSMPDGLSPMDMPKKKKIDVKDVFNQDEDDNEFGGGKKRKLVPLDFGEDSSKKSKKEEKIPEDKKKHIKSLIDKIPTDKEALFKYEIDWGKLDHTLMEKRIRPWINKKIIDYIGEPEPTLVDFICSKVLGRSAPQSILDDVMMVLDEEAEVFVVKMWRLLVYEIEAKNQKMQV